MAENVSVKLFADDAKIYAIIIDGKTSSNQSQHSLDIVVVSWAEHWQLELSPSKCILLCVNLTGSLSC
jgi:hypothetical protein